MTESGLDKFEEKLRALREAFALTLVDKIHAIETTTYQSLNEGIALIHMLSGSAGTYGFVRLGEIAQQLEAFCRKCDETNKEPSKEDWKKIDGFIQDLRKNIIPGPDERQIEQVIKNIARSASQHRTELSNNIILVDDDFDQSEVLGELLTNFGFSVHILDHPSKLQKAIDEQSPMAVIMDIVFSHDRDAGLTTINELRSDNLLQCPVIFISTRNDFSARLEAIRSGSDGYLVKPVNVIEMVETLDRLIEARKKPKFRVLIADDDPEITSFCQALLENFNLDVLAINDPMKALDNILSFKPDVIVLDIEMPDCDGFDLGSAIRQMSDELLQTPILYLTAHSEQENKLKAARSGSEDFLSKPVNPNLFVTSVLARAERSRVLGGLYHRMKASEERFTSVAQTANEAIILCDDRGLIHSWNPCSERIFGYTELEVLGRNVDILIPEEFRQAHHHSFARFMEFGEQKIISKTVEVLGLKKGGSRFSAELSLSSWVSDGKTFFSATIRDITLRKGSEEKLRKSNQDLSQFKKLVDESSEGLYIIDCETSRFVDASRAAWELLGYSTIDELMKISVRDIREIPITQEQWTKEIEGLRNVGGKRFETRHRRKDGSCIDVEISWRLFVDGEQSYLVAASRDITERKRDEIKLSNSLAELDAQKYALDQHAIVSITDVTGKITYANNHFCEISGFSLDELLGQNHRILKSNEHSQDFYEELWQTISNGKVWRGEIKNKKKNAGFYWVDATIVPFLNEKGNPYQYVAIRTNITKRKNAESSLLKSEQRALFFTDNVEEGIVISENNLIIDASDRLYEMFKSTSESTIGKSPLYFVAEHDKNLVIEKLSTKNTEPYEADLLRSDGSTFPALVKGKDGEFGDRSVRITTVLDITQQKENEVALVVAKQDAEKANKAKSEFLSSMSHELRTPLNAVIGFAQILEISSRDKLTERQQKCVTHILDGGKHLLELINEVLDLAKIEAGHIKINLEDINIENLIEECSDLLEPLADNRKITISKEPLLEPKTMVRADNTRLKQCFINISSNAIKYNKDGGEVIIRTEAFGDNIVRISIQDTGIGIPEDRKAELFQAFNRLDAGSTEIEGTGIGLVLTKILLEEMGASIGFSSEFGQGSTFWMDIPLSASHHSSQPIGLDENVIVKFPTTKGTLLYVEDNKANIEFMEMVVNQIPELKLVTAATGEEGLGHALMYNPDLIILDINLPEIDGNEILRQLKKSEQTEQIPVIAYSAAATTKEIDRAIRAGYMNYLTKPIIINEAVKIIKSTIEKTKV